jgi:hypothetical protein
MALTEWLKLQELKVQAAQNTEKEKGVYVCVYVCCLSHSFSCFLSSFAFLEYVGYFFDQDIHAHVFLRRTFL